MPTDKSIRNGALYIYYMLNTVKTQLLRNCFEEKCCPINENISYSKLMFGISLILEEIARNTPDWIFTFFFQQTHILRTYSVQALFLTLGIQQETRPLKHPTPSTLCLVEPRKETIYNKINKYNKISGKERL